MRLMRPKGARRKTWRKATTTSRHKGHANRLPQRHRKWGAAATKIGGLVVVLCPKTNSQDLLEHRYAAMLPCRER